jgi:hypothetical protein
MSRVFLPQSLWNREVEIFETSVLLLQFYTNTESSLDTKLRVSIPRRIKNVQTLSRTHPVSIALGTEDSLKRLNSRGVEQTPHI